MLFDALITYYLILTQPVPDMKVDLRPQFPPVFDQGKTRSCVSHSVASVIMYHRKVDTLDAKVPISGNLFPTVNFPSRLDLYHQSRDDKTKDDGATFKMTMDVLQGDTGLCDESDWPFNDRPKTILRPEPPPKCLKNRKPYTDFHPFHLPANSRAVAYAIRRHRPVVVGLRLPLYFFKTADIYKKGRLTELPKPNRAESQIVSLHAMVAVGTSEENTIVLRNSWTKNWGDGGYVIVPSTFLDLYISDAWTLRPLL